MPVTTRQQSRTLENRLRSEIFACTTGESVIWLFEEQNLFSEYADPDAAYDAEWYTIPFDVWFAMTGITQREISDLNMTFEAYQGALEVYDGMVTITGSA